jgi:hypothetical protein
MSDKFEATQEKVLGFVVDHLGHHAEVRNDVAFVVEVTCLTCLDPGRFEVRSDAGKRILLSFVRAHVRHEMAVRRDAAEMTMTCLTCLPAVHPPVGGAGPSAG